MQWYREPLLHFLLAGLALFAVYGGFRATPQREEPRRIEITADDIRRLEIAWGARWQRPPTTLEMRGLIEEQVRGTFFTARHWRSASIRATRS
jgi:hypothetical protein